MSETLSRRERLRTETTRDIKRIALELMAAGGPGAISLRAIAREIGMTAGALYGYFPTRDDLVTTLIVEIYTDCVDTLQAARDAATTPAARVRAWAEALRDWALANPQGFRLIYGDPVPGYEPPTDSSTDAPRLRACSILISLVADAWPQAEARQNGSYAWSDFSDHVVEQTREEFPELPPAAVALSLRLWGRVHGLIALEIYGHLRPISNDPAALFRAELTDLLRSLGLDP